MKNSERLKEKFEDCKQLRIQMEAIRASVQLLHPEYLFCFHLHFDIPTVTCWIKNNSPEGIAILSISDNTVHIASLGEYSYSVVQDMVDTITTWLEENADEN